jgi:hypothetical protein
MKVPQDRVQRQALILVVLKHRVISADSHSINYVIQATYIVACNHFSYDEPFSEKLYISI